MKDSPFWIVGLNHGAHDGAAALLRDGEIVVIIEQERLSRRKHAINESPAQALASCLSYAGIGLEDVGVVALGSDHDALAQWLGLSARERAEQLPFDDPARLFPSELFGDARRPRLVCVPHHMAHAASTFWPSGLPDAAILIIDAMGEDCSTTLARGSSRGIEILETHGISSSLGYFYEAATRYAGFKTGEAGKLMGLASYGRANQPMPLAFDGRLTWNSVPESRGIGRTMITERRQSLLKFFAASSYPFGIRADDSILAYADFAASAQKALEECILSLATRACELARSDNLVLAGGVALNCSANGVLWRSHKFRQIFVQPMADDAGVALGAALHTAHQLFEQAPPCQPMAHAYWGLKDTAFDIEEALMRFNLVGSKLADNELLERTAKILAGGGIVAWHQGRAEVGPRALGARSLLGDPRRRQSLVRLNTAKKREMWRPLAPVVAADAFHRYFNGCPSPFMIIAAEVRPEFRQQLPAITHIDGSARPQAIKPLHNPRYFGLLQEFAKLSGFPILINTSLNIAEEPIAQSAQDSIRAFLESRADALVLDNYFVAAT